MKKILVFMLLLFIIPSNTALAHTGMTNSSPADGEEVVGEVHEVALEFNTSIESTSTVKVSDENGEEIDINNIVIDDRVMTGAFMSPLDNGTYTVDWKIIGEDGHPIQGSYIFVVSQEEPVGTTTKDEASTETPESSNGQTIDVPAEQPMEDPSKIASNDVLVVILVLLFTIAGGFVGWIIGRRQK